MRRIICQFLLLFPLSAPAADFVSTGVGGGGWLHAGAMLPADSNVVVIGADVTGATITRDFGLSWRPWNEGLVNQDELPSYYVEDLEGIDFAGWSGFYAATYGGLYRREAEGAAWELLTEPHAYAYRDTTFWNAVAIHFGCLDWAQDSLLVIGAGKPRWETASYETNYYPGLPADRYRPRGDFDRQWTVWTLSLNDPLAGPQPLPGAEFGSARDITTAVLDGRRYIAVATRDNIHLHDGTDWSLVGNSFANVGLSAYSLHLTARGTLYAALHRPGETSTLASGVYRIFDIRERSPWHWVGDHTPLPPENLSVQEIGLLNWGTATNRTDLCYLSVLDGAGQEPDLLYLGDRKDKFGLFRGEQAYTTADSSCTWQRKIYWDYSNFWYVDGTGTPRLLDVGWNDYWGSNVLFHPIVSPYHPDQVALQDQARFHLSRDRGDSWIQGYTEYSDGWSSRGYNELCVAGLAFLSDGRLVESTADCGSFRSTDAALDAFEIIGPEIDQWASPYDDQAWTEETADIRARADWQSWGADALFVNAGDVVQKYQPCKFLYMDGSGQWHNASYMLNQVESLYNLLFSDFIFTDDDTCFLTYQLYDRRVGSSGQKLVEFGVFRGVYTDDGQGYSNLNWSWEKVNDGLRYAPDWSPDSFNARAGKLLHHAPTGRVFLACQDHVAMPENTVGISARFDVKGALFALESPAASTWQHAFGGNGYYGEADSTVYMDFRSLAQAADGSALYAGTRGRATGWGTVLVCEDPAGDPTNWQPLANVTDYPFDFVPPFWADGSLPGESNWSFERANRTLTDIRALAVDPWNPHVVFAGMSAPGFQSENGLWVYNRNYSGQWEHLSSSSFTKGVAVSHLAFSPVEMGRLVIGTGCNELYHVRIDSLWGSTGVGDFTPEPHPGPGLRLLSLRSLGEAGGARLRLALRRESPVRMDIYDVQGRRLRRLAAGRLPAGESELHWDGRNDRGRPSASGVYFVRLSAENEAVSGKLVYLK